MGVYIKGMEMPKAGNWKTIRIYYDGTCAEANWQGDCKYMQGCEAVPVPPHGRLIDADVLRQDWLENGENEYVYDTNSFLAGIDYAPTIIPAEEATP